MFLEFGYRSACCHAPIRLGKKKIKNTKLTVNIWICCNCEKRDVNIVERNKTESFASTDSPVDKD